MKIFELYPIRLEERCIGASPTYANAYQHCEGLFSCVLIHVFTHALSFLIILLCCFTFFFSYRSSDESKPVELFILL